MAGKEKISFVRSKDFETIDDDLTEALNGLEEANDRILKLLETEKPPVLIDSSSEEAADSSAQEAAPAAGAPM